MKLPELKELPTQELVDRLTAERDALAAQVEQLKPLARRCLWGAVNWNDHNFEPLHEYCRKSAADAGVFTVDQANALLEQTPAKCLAEIKAQAVEEAVSLYTHKWHKDEEINLVNIGILRGGVGLIFPAGLIDYADELRQAANGGE